MTASRQQSSMIPLLRKLASGGQEPNSIRRMFATGRYRDGQHRSTGEKQALIICVDACGCLRP